MSKLAPPPWACSELYISSGPHVLLLSSQGKVCSVNGSKVWAISSTGAPRMPLLTQATPLGAPEKQNTQCVDTQHQQSRECLHSVAELGRTSAASVRVPPFLFLLCHTEQDVRGCDFEWAPGRSTRAALSSSCQARPKAGCCHAVQWLACSSFFFQLFQLFAKHYQVSEVTNN